MLTVVVVYADGKQKTMKAAIDAARLPPFIRINGKRFWLQSLEPPTFTEEV